MAGMDAFLADDLKRMLDHCLDKALFLCAVLALGCGTGARIGEVLLLLRSTVLIDGRIPDVLKLPKLKTGKTSFREIPWNHTLDKYLLPWLVYQQDVLGIELGSDYVFSRKPGKAVHYKQVWAEMKTMFQLLKIPGRKATHSMRKTFARFVYDYYLQQYGGDQLKALESTRLALGHFSIKDTIKYLNLELESLHNATDVIFEFLK